MWLTVSKEMIRPSSALFASIKSLSFLNTAERSCKCVYNTKINHIAQDINVNYYTTCINFNSACFEALTANEVYPK